MSGIDSSETRAYLQLMKMSPSLGDSHNKLQLMLLDESSEEHLLYTYQKPELTTVIAPKLGPARGGTNVTISGDGLGGGSHYLCRCSVLDLVPCKKHEMKQLASLRIDARMQSRGREAEQNLVC